MTKNLTDHIGMITACTCIVHCIALPFLLLFTSFTDFEQFHEITLAVTVLVTGHALWHGYRQHCKHIVMLFGGLGAICLVGGLIAHEFAHGSTNIVHGNHIHTIATHSRIAEVVEIGATVVGSLMIVIAHIYNIRFKKCCNTVA